MAEDIGVDAVKIGMLGTAETVRAVREALALLDDGVPIVIDPVMVAESGAVLLDDEARRAIVTDLLPLATVITPNLPEARVLAEGAGDDVEELARALHALGPANVVITGGHRAEATDVFYDGSEIHLLPGERHPDGAAHGSGLHALERARRASRARLQPRWRRRRRRARSRRRPFATGCGTSARARGPCTCSARRSGDCRRSTWRDRAAGRHPPRDIMRP